MELTQHAVELRGLRMAVHEAGSGPPLLLVHGLLVNHLEWAPVIARLAGSFRCIAPDLIGFGQSDKPSEKRFPYTREAFVETLRDLLRELEIARAHVAGHSLGGAIAIQLAADHPELVDRLAVVDSAVYEFRLPMKGRLPLVPVLGPITFKRLYGRKMFRAYFEDDVFSGHGGVDLDRVDAYYDDFDGPGGRDAAYAALLNTLDVASVTPRIRRVQAETLVVWGDDDRLVPVGLAHRLARDIPRARLEIVARSGHAPNEEHPDRVADLLREHFVGGR